MLKIKDLRIFEKIIRNYINFFINYKVTIMKKNPTRHNTKY